MKKILTLLCMITCVFGLTACGKEKEILPYNQSAVDAATEAIYSLVSSDYDEPGIMNELKSYDKFQWEMIEEGWRQQIGLKTSGRAVINGIESFSNAREDIGDVLGITDKTYQADADSLTAYVEVDGQSRDAVIEIIFDKDLIVTDITTNVSYSFGEQMGKAGANTLMGMGTVFSVLIIIMIIISCFKFIAKAEANVAAKKKEENLVDHAITQIVQNEELEVTDHTDDLELVAAIAAVIAAGEGKTVTDGFVVRSIRKR